MRTILNKLLPKTFAHRIIMLIATLGIIAAIANLSISGYYEYKFLKRNITATLTNQFQAVSRIFAEAVIYNNIYDLFTRAEAMVQFLDFVDNIYIFDEHGAYLTDAKVRKEYPDINFLQAENIHVYNLSAGNERVGYIVYIENNSYVINTLIAHLSGLGIFGLLLLFTGIMIGGFLSAFLTRPLDSLSQQIRNFSGLPMKLQVPEYAPEEVRLLSSTLNELSKIVSEQEKKIVRGEKLASIGTMAAGLAHQLKNPIMTIELLTHCISEKRGTEEDINVMRKEAAHITDILNEFLNLSKPLYVIVSDFRISELIKNLQETVSGRFRGEIVLKTDIKHDVAIKCDMAKLIDILLNLVTNAYEANASYAEISVLENENCSKIIISDDGRGVSEDIRSRIFHPFFTSKSSGTGLGLAYAEMVLEAMSGSIELGKTNFGTSFIITLPRGNL